MLLSSGGSEQRPMLLSSGSERSLSGISSGKRTFAGIGAPQLDGLHLNRLLPTMESASLGSASRGPLGPTFTWAPLQQLPPPPNLHSIWGQNDAIRERNPPSPPPPPPPPPPTQVSNIGILAQQPVIGDTNNQTYLQGAYSTLLQNMQAGRWGAAMPSTGLPSLPLRQGSLRRGNSLTSEEWSVLASSSFDLTPAGRRPSLTGAVASPGDSLLNMNTMGGGGGEGGISQDLWEGEW